MEPGEIDESEITRSDEPESSRSHGRKGRYKARRQHKRQQTETSLPFEPPKRFRLETHLARKEPIPKRLPASGHHTILNPAYTGAETPRWAAFRLSKVIKEDSLGRLEDGVKGLSRYGIRHSMGHKAKVLNTRIRHVRSMTTSSAGNHESLFTRWTQPLLDPCLLIIAAYLAYSILSTQDSH